MPAMLDDYPRNSLNFLLNQKKQQEKKRKVKKVSNAGLSSPDKVLETLEMEDKSPK